jgi:hypothetical protein
VNERFKELSKLLEIYKEEMEKRLSAIEINQ